MFEIFKEKIICIYNLKKWQNLYFVEELFTEIYDWENVQIYKWATIDLFCFLVKCIILAFHGVLPIGIQNSYILQERYEPHLDLSGK